MTGGLDLYSVQQNIVAYVKAQFPKYHVEEDAVPDDSTLLRDGSGNVKTYFVLTFGSMQPKPTGGSFGGVRWDDYQSFVDVWAVSGVPGNARAALSLVVDKLIGFVPGGANAMSPRGTTATITIKNMQGQNTAYMPSQRLNFGLNGASVATPIVP